MVTIALTHVLQEAPLPQHLVSLGATFCVDQCQSDWVGSYFLHQSQLLMSDTTGQDEWQWRSLVKRARFLSYCCEILERGQRDDSKTKATKYVSMHYTCRGTAADPRHHCRPSLHMPPHGKTSATSSLWSSDADKCWALWLYPRISPPPPKKKKKNQASSPHKLALLSSTFACPSVLPTSWPPLHNTQSRAYKGTTQK